MKNRRLLSLCMVVLLLISLLAGCGKAEYAADAGGVANRAPEIYEDGVSSEKESVEFEAPVNQKLIRRIYINTETEDLDALMTQAEQRIAQLGGYVESRQINNGSSTYKRSRNAELTVRIPADQLDQFVTHVTDASNITSLRETTEDVTLSYVATESRIAALETQEARLLELLAKAETMSDLLEIESKLTDVRTELSQVKSTLKIYDNQITYGTIYLSISEVKEFTETEEPEGFFGRIGKGFVSSLTGLWKMIQELVILLIANLPYLVFFGAIAAAIIIPIRLHHKKKKKNAT